MGARPLNFPRYACSTWVGHKCDLAVEDFEGKDGSSSGESGSTGKKEEFLWANSHPYRGTTLSVSFKNGKICRLGYFGTSGVISDMIEFCHVVSISSCPPGGLEEESHPTLPGCSSAAKQCKSRRS